MKHGKKYRSALKKAPQKPVSVEEAVKFVKANAGAKFDETVDVYFRLGKELTKGDTAVRGIVKLPNGSGKTVKVAVFAGGDAAEAAKNAGADYVGMSDLVEKVSKEGWCDFDVAIATVEAMKEVRKCARVLGPRGLMPNPKHGHGRYRDGRQGGKGRQGRFPHGQDGQRRGGGGQAQFRRGGARPEHQGRDFRGPVREAGDRQGRLHQVNEHLLHNGSRRARHNGDGCRIRGRRNANEN